MRRVPVATGADRPRQVRGELFYERTCRGRVVVVDDQTQRSGGTAEKAQLSEAAQELSEHPRTPTGGDAYPIRNSAPAQLRSESETGAPGGVELIAGRRCGPSMSPRACSKSIRVFSTASSSATQLRP